MVGRVRSRLSSLVFAARPVRQAGGHWFEPSTAHRRSKSGLLSQAMMISIGLCRFDTAVADAGLAGGGDLGGCVSVGGS